MIRKLIWALVAVICLGPVHVYSEEKTADTDAVYTLGEVVVTAPEETLGVEAISTPYEITAKEIEMRQVKSLDKALELLPGLDVRNGGQGIPRINIRGLRPRHVVLLLNGIPFNSTYDGQFDPTTIPVENIAKIKVTYGTHSVLYGQGGMGGVINIITKKGTQEVHGNVAADIDERGGFNGQADLSGGNEKIDFFVSGSKQNTDGFQVSSDFVSTSQEDGGLRENSDADRTNLFANLGFQADDSVQLGLTVGSNTGDYGKPPSVNDDKTDSFYKNPKYDRVNDYTGHFGQVSAGYNPGGVFSLRSWAYVNKYEEDSARYDDENYDSITQKGGYETSDETLVKGITVQGTFDYDTYGQVAVSLNAEKNEYDSVGGIIEKKGGDLVDYDISHKIDLYSLAFEYTIKPIDKLGLVLGYSHHWQHKDEGSDDDKGSYLLGAAYDLNDLTRLRASYARKIRFASIKNLYDASSGNEELTTEESDNYEAGISRKLPWDLTADLTFFLYDVKDYIEKDDSTDIYENNEKYQFKGIELFFSKPILDGGQVRVGYSYMDSQDKSEGSQRDDLEYRPKHKITVDGNYSFTCGLTAYASFMHVMGQYHYSSDYEKGELDDFSIVDLKLEQRIFQSMAYVYAGVDNLFDEDYEESYGYPQAGRTAYIGMKLKF